MSPLIRPDAPEPVLIVTDAEYRRAFSPPVAGRKTGRAVVWVVLLSAASAGAALWLAREKPRPAAVSVAVVPAPRPRAVPPPAIVEPPPPAPRPPVAVAAPPPVEEEEPPAEPVSRPVPPAPRCEGRAWVRLQLRWEHRAQLQESERRVVFVGDGTRYVLERAGAGPADPWLDRLELLFQLPEEHESWQRQVTRTGFETIHLRKGDLACRVVEGQDRFPQGVRRFRYWYSDEFPAGAVRAEQTLGDLVFACRVLDFGPEPSRKP